MDHSTEAHVSLVVTRRNSAERFESAKEVLDEMAPAISVEVAGYLLLSIGLGRDHGNGASIIQFSSKPIGIESFVGQEHVEVDGFDQRLDAGEVVTLPWKQHESDQVTQRVNESDDLCRQSTT